MRLSGLTEHLPLKVFSLFVAVLLYIFVSVESGTAIDVEAAVEYRTADDIMLTSDAPSKVVATLTGPWATIRSFGELEPLIIDLADAEPSHIRHSIDNADIRSPAGMKVVSVRPSVLEITLDRRVEKLLAVEVDPLGRPAFGYEIADMKADPPRVSVAGPLGAFREINFIHTRPVSLHDREEDLTVEVALRPPAPPLRLVGEQSVKVFVDIAEEILQRDFNLPVKLENAPRGTKTTPTNVMVTLIGPRRIVDRIDKKTLIAVVDARPEIDSQRTFEKSVAVQPDLPDQTQILGTVPKVEITAPRRRRRR